MAVPDIDSEVGLLCYSTGFPGCGGRIRASPGDFEVGEILSPDAARSIGGSGGYPVYSLSKEGIDTRHALSGLFRRTGVRLRALGLKDANAVTTQYAYSGTRAAGIDRFEGGRYSFRRLGYTKRPLSKRHMAGNRFSVRITGSASDPGAFGEHGRILNFYGYQRFGSARPVTHLIGKALVQGRYDDAVDCLLSSTSGRDSDANNRIRREMADRSRLGEVRGRIPPGMDLERIVASELADHGDPLAALRALPVDMRRFYVQAYQSYLFNLTVGTAHGSGEDMFEPQDGDVCYDAGGSLQKSRGAPGRGGGGGERLAVPVVGYSYYKKTRFHPYVSRIMGEQGVAPRDFYIKDLQEASGEGGFRGAAVAVDDFAADGGRVSFTLSRGSFATVVLREIIKPADPLASGF